MQTLFAFNLKNNHHKGKQDDLLTLFRPVLIYYIKFNNCHGYADDRRFVRSFVYREYNCSIQRGSPMRSFFHDAVEEKQVYGESFGKKEENIKGKNVGILDDVCDGTTWLQNISYMALRMIQNDSMRIT